MKHSSCSANPFSWAPKVPQAWIARLYAADADVPDEALAEKVGWALAARCDSIIEVTTGYETGRLSCPRCGSILCLTEEMTCSCGFTASLAQFRASYRRKQLYGANALPVFRTYRRDYLKAETYREKMAAIDTLIHSFHLLHSYRLAESEETQAVWTAETDSDVSLGRSTAVNLIEGTLTEVVRFLDTLSAGDEHWRQTLYRSNGATAGK